MHHDNSISKLVVAALALSLAAAGSLAGCKGKDDKADKGKKTAKKPDTPPKPDKKPDPPKPKADDGLPPAPIGLAGWKLTPHDHNKTTPAKVELGEYLFFDTRLSDGGKFACVTCHLPKMGWTDGKKLSPKHNGDLNKRHSPTMYNVGYALAWYWDGRKKTLEDQILAAWKGQVGATPDKIAPALTAIPKYKEMFQKAFGEDPTPDNIPKALASFLRVKLRSGNAPWDKHKAGDKTAVSEDAIKGEAVFMGKAKCGICHTPPLYTDMRYHNVGVGYKGVESPDVGRFKVSQKENETGAFKTPGLRNVTLSAPYFHDGSASTLEEAVDFMIAGGYRDNNKHIDPMMTAVKLSADERKQLLAFLETLTEDTQYTPPNLP